MISDNTIRENSANNYGGGICCSYSIPVISGNILAGNSASWGGGIFCSYSSASIISNNTLCGNSAPSGGGGFFCGYNTSPTLVNSILWGNTPDQIYGGAPQVSYSDIEGGLPGEGNFSLDPCFVDPANGDYHLQSTAGSFHGGLWAPDSLHSPCIDAGDPSSPFALEPMPNGSRINLGFEGNASDASLSTPTWAAPSGAELRNKFCLHSPFPNPFNPSTAISYELRAASLVNLRIFDTAGRFVSELVNGWRDAGEHQITFEGSGLPSGIFFAKLQAGEFSQVQKLILPK